MATWTTTEQTVTWTAVDDPSVTWTVNVNPTVTGGGGVTDHGALTGLADDDHTQYALADGSRGSFAAASHTHAAGDITSGTMATARLGSGTANSSTFLRGDQTYAAPTVDVVSNVATSRILGRTTSGSGDSEELTAAQVRTLIRDASDWHVIYDDVLESDGTFTAPTWTSDYTDIEVRVTGRGTDTSNSSAGIRVRFNGDTGSNYFMNNGTAQTLWNNVGSMPGSQTNTDRQGLWVANITLGGVGKYTVADIRNVTWTSTATAGSAPTAPSAYYTNTSAAVTSIDVFLSFGTFTAGSRMTVRGRKAP